MLNYYTQCNYGVDLHYPVGKIAESHMRLTGKKTMDKSDMEVYSALLGMEFEEVTKSSLSCVS